MADYDQSLQRSLQALGVNNHAAVILAQKIYSLQTQITVGSGGLVEDPDDPGTFIGVSS